MAALWTVFRRVEFQMGDCIVQPCEAFEDEHEAELAARRRDRVVGEILASRIVSPEDGSVVEGGVRGFINALGIVSIGHAALPVNVVEKRKLASPDGDNVVPIGSSRIIMP